jgi:hypothetical protein
MIRKEAGKISLNNITLTEYDDDRSDVLNYHIQCGIAGFFANERELKALCAVLNYYYNLELWNDIVLTVNDTEVSDEK